MDAVNPIEVEYRKRIDGMTISQRIERAAELFAWSRGFVARQILAEHGPISEDRLKWEVALRQYGAEPGARSLIEGILARVPR